MTTAKVATDLCVLVYQIWLRYVKGGRVMAIYVFQNGIGGWPLSWIFAEVKFEGISVSGTFVFAPRLLRLGLHLRLSC